MNQDKSKVVVICGPTGSGKTAAAIELAVRFNGQIISADSMQVFRYMDIGTAKPTPAEQRRVRHHLIDVAAPDEPFNAARYADLARGLISRLQTDGIIPFVVGGTGLYIKALLKGLFQVKPVIGSTYPLAETADAMAEVGGGHARGKIAITVGAA